MSFLARFSCRVKLIFIAGLLAGSTGLAALAQILPLSRVEILSFWTAALVGGSLAIAALAMTAHGIMSSIDKLAHRAQSIAQGDLTGEPFQFGTQDEIGQLALSINRMQPGATQSS
jgi:HAMP domain-containing protein